MYTAIQKVRLPPILTNAMTYITKKTSNTVEPHILVLGQRLEIDKEVKYFGIVIDSYLTLIKKVRYRVKYNLANDRYIRNCMSTEATTMYMNAMIISHLIYCLTSRSQASSSTLRPLESLYKQTMKTLNKKPYSFTTATYWKNIIF